MSSKKLLNRHTTHRYITKLKIKCILKRKKKEKIIRKKRKKKGKTERKKEKRKERREKRERKLIKKEIYTLRHYLSIIFNVCLDFIVNYVCILMGLRPTGLLK